MDSEKLELQTGADPTDAERVAKADPAVRILRVLELCGLEIDHGQIKQTYRGLADSWLLSVAGETLGPTTFSGVMAVLVDGHSPIGVLHSSEIKGDSPPWREIKYSPFWLRCWVARIWAVCFWSLAVLIGLAVVVSVVPRPLHFFVRPLYWIAIAGVLVWRFKLIPRILRKRNKDEPREPTLDEQR